MYTAYARHRRLARWIVCVVVACALSFPVSAYAVSGTSAAGSASAAQYEPISPPAPPPLPFTGYALIGAAALGIGVLAIGVGVRRIGGTRR